MCSACASAAAALVSTAVCAPIVFLSSDAPVTNSLSGSSGAPSYETSFDKLAERATPRNVHRGGHRGPPLNELEANANAMSFQRRWKASCVSGLMVRQERILNPNKFAGPSIRRAARELAALRH